MSADIPAQVRTRIAEAIATQTGLLEQVDAIAAAAGALTDSLRAGGQVLLCGNGGSATDALHLAGELVGRFYKDRAPLPALALVANPAAVTAIANDYGYEEVFARQVRGLGRPGDVLIGLSTSGTSPNVVAAMVAAREGGLTRIAMTGRDGGPLADAADHVIAVPSDTTPRIQEGHILAGHVLCELAEAWLFG